MPAVWTDGELVTAIVGGDTEAEEEFVRRYRPLVLGLARSRYGMASQDADDLLQTVLLTLWQDDCKVFRAWKGRGRFSSYLTVIVCRLCQNRRAVAVAAERPTAPREAEAPSPSPADSTLARERREEVLRAMATLSPRDRLLLSFRFFDEREPKDFAPLLGLTAGAARKAVHDALIRLRRRLRAVAPPRDASLESPEDRQPDDSPRTTVRAVAHQETSEA